MRFSKNAERLLRLGTDQHRAEMLILGSDGIYHQRRTRALHQHLRAHAHLLRRLRLMWDGIATDECGEDVSDNLIHGDAVSHAWHDGVSEWLLAVAATERPYINFPVFGSEAVVTRGRTDVGKCDAAVR